MSEWIQDFVFWCRGLTMGGRAEAVWYALRRLFMRPVEIDRCFMGGPVHSMIWCPRAVEADGLWCRVHAGGTGEKEEKMRLWTTDGDPEPVDVEQAGLRRASASEVVAALQEEGADEFEVEANPTPVPDPWTGEPMQNYPIVKQGVFETTHTTLKPGRYLVVRIDGDSP